MKNDPVAAEPMHLHLPLGATELTIRQGQADPIVHPKSIIISGTLKAPSQFLNGKETVFKTEEAHLRIFTDKGRLELYLQDTDPHCTHIINGCLTPDTELAAWKINSTARWGVAPFLEFIKTRRYFFENGAECTEMVNSLRTWDAEVQTLIKQHSDTAGNSLVSLEKKVSGVKLKTKFRLAVPVYQGYPKENFDIEVGFDPQSNEVKLFLISEDLYMLELELRAKYMEEALVGLTKFGCSKVVMS